MMKYTSTVTAISLAVLLSSPVLAQAPVTDVKLQTGASVSNAELVKRLDDLSRVITVRNKMQLRFQNQLDEISLEVREMRGSVEQIENQLSQVESRQRSLFQMLEEQRQKVAGLSSHAAPLLTTTASSAQGTQGAAEESEYKTAVGLVVTDKQYAEAIVAFKAFVKKYPQSSYVPNAQYWLGQLLYREKQYSDARVAFLVVTEQFPDSNKRADSLLKIGMIDDRTGNKASAKSYYQKTITSYPGSSAAKLAEKYLADK